jgi:hypothetical protein
MSGTALFVALGGTAVAVTQVGTSQIKDNAVIAAKIKHGAVTTAKIRNGAVVSSNLAAGAVGAVKLANDAVSGPKIANNAVASSQLADGAVWSSKLGADAVANGNLAAGAVSTTSLTNDAVTSAKVADGSRTVGDVAPNTFLAAGGTAANSSELGGEPAGAFVSGSGRVVSDRLVLSAGQGPTTLLELGFGQIDATGASGSISQLSFVAELPVDNMIAWTTTSGSPDTVDIQARGGFAAGSSFEEPHTEAAPQSMTWQATYNNGTHEQVATTCTTGESASGGCVFTGQGVTTL